MKRFVLIFAAVGLVNAAFVLTVEAGPVRNFLSRLRPSACASGACSPRTSTPRASCYRLPNGTMVCPTK